MEQNVDTKQWFRGASFEGRSIGIEELAAELERQKATKQDYVVDARALEMRTRNGQVCLAFPAPGNGETLEQGIKPYAHGQIAEKTGIPRAYYDRMLSQAPELLAANVNRWIPARERRMVRTLDGNVRAMLSSRYKILDSIDLFYNAYDIFRRVDAKILRADVSETRMYIRAVAPQIQEPIQAGDVLCGGVVLSNSEVGAGALRIEEFVLRVRCMNGMVGDDVYSRVHLGEDLGTGIYSDRTIDLSTKALWARTKDHVANAFRHETVRKFAQRMKDAKEVEIPSATELVQGGWTNLGVQQSEKDKVLHHLLTDGEGLTQFGFSNAVTATARDLSDAERRQALEKLAALLVKQNPEDFKDTMGVAAKPEKKRR